MEDFSIVLRDLVNKNINKINIELPENIKKEFESTAENFLKKDLTLEAIKVFAIIKNKDKLNEIGGKCIEETKPDLALIAFSFSDNKEGLTKTGMEFIKQVEIKKALQAFKLANNKEMIDFISKNFQNF